MAKDYELSDWERSVISKLPEWAAAAVATAAASVLVQAEELGRWDAYAWSKDDGTQLEANVLRVPNVLSFDSLISIHSVARSIRLSKLMIWDAALLLTHSPHWLESEYATFAEGLRISENKDAMKMAIFFHRLFSAVHWAGKDKITPKDIALRGAIALHGKPGGNWQKQFKIKLAWASGKYTSRDICAEQECAAINMSFSSARKALRGTPNPT